MLETNKHRTCASSIYTSTYTKMEDDFHNSRIVSVLGLSTFVLGISFGPMFLSPLSEFYGRRPIYLVAWTTYVIFIIPQAVSKNIATVLVFRFLDGFTGSAFLAVSGGTVGDLFARSELQAPMALFSVSPFVGPSMGPLLGGFINYNVSWRWTYYVLLIWSGIVWIAVVFFVPETYRKYMFAHSSFFSMPSTQSTIYVSFLASVHGTCVSVRFITCSNLQILSILVSDTGGIKSTDHVLSY